MKKPTKFLTARILKHSLLEVLGLRDENSPFPEDDDYEPTKPNAIPVCPVIRYDNVSYVCTKRQEKCTGDCRACSYGVRI